MVDINRIREQLQRSKFRTGFELSAEDLAYIDKIGLEKIESHAVDFIDKRLSMIDPGKDGKQTPFKGHPVFKAQHATATCCRGCLEKWYRIERNRMLNDDEKIFIRKIIMEWIRSRFNKKV